MENKRRGVQMIKVSVIVAVYNEERFLYRCLDSICGQSLKEIEIICVDDGSTDSSLQILQSYAQRDNRIKILTQKNQFAGVARNYGMEYATGKYLSFLDADDYFETDMLERMYQKAEEGKSDIVICRYAQYCETNQKFVPVDWSYIDSFFIQKENFSADSLKHAGIFQITKGWAWDKLFRTEFVRQCDYKFSNFRSSEDGYFVNMLLVRARNLSYMDDVLLTHRVNNPMSLSSTKDKNWLNGFKMLLLMKSEMERLNCYTVYEQSYLNEVVFFLDWYLRTMNSFESFRKTYLFIQNVMEQDVGVLNYGREYYFQKECFDVYQRVVTTPLERYLYEEQQNSIRMLERQWGMLAKLQAEKDWVFPYHLIEKEKTLILYGAGKIGESYYSQLVDSQFCKEVIWVDTYYEKYTAAGRMVQNPEIILSLKYDYIFLAVKDSKSQEEIKKWLLREGVKAEQIICYGQNNDEDSNSICD